MNDSYHSKTIQKAINVLNLFKTHNKLSFTDIKNILKINKSTLFRILYTLEYNKYIVKDSNGWYKLGINIFILGHTVSNEMQLNEIAEPYLNKIADKTNLTVHLGILDGLDVVIINKSSPDSKIMMVSRIGSSVPPHCTGQGKTFLAHVKEDSVLKIINKHGLKRYTANTISNIDDLFKELETIRKRGYTVDSSEHEEHLHCIAVPILNDRNRIEATISVTGMSLNFQDQGDNEKYAKILNTYVDKIRAKMGYIKEKIS